MQYHLNGFTPGDPARAPEADGATDVSDAVDVLIIGCGPAGLTLATQLAAFRDITTRITERKTGPLIMGQADGLACRSLEMFAAFGFAEKVVKEAYHVNEVAFWRPGEEGEGLTRAERIQDVEDDLSEMPHVILSQARLHDFFLERMAQSPRRLVPDYAYDLCDVSYTDDPDHPITARFDTPDGPETIHARYLVGCDGARSTVRTAMGLTLQGASARQLWGVMDVLVVTDFPDIRLKCAIQSAGEGSILIIPREGGYMVRMYIELDELQGDERAADRNVTAEMLIAKAQAILAPYVLEVKEVVWCSAYEIGQRVCDRFDDASDVADPRVFIAGDACHTHSPKAGQGMNVSMADTFNLGWKLAHVLRGQAEPALLRSYSAERQAKAKELIDFDRDMARLFSAKPRDSEETAQFQRYFKKHGRYTAGVATRYDASALTGPATHQALASGQIVGMRFHSAPVIRLGDAKRVHLGHMFAADGRWRILAFGGQDDTAIDDLCTFLADDPKSPLRRFTGKGVDIDSVIDVRVVYPHSHRDKRLEALPTLLLPRKGKHGLIDYEKVFCPTTPDIYDLRGIDRKKGVLLVLRPDQFVSAVLPLSDLAGLCAIFDNVLVPKGC
ncbi:FAD-dependent monooxygenase [Sulfitobacter sp. TSTF-M16]|uniref:FAD-dependent monooxygenase n=1 Tax=Sulfitobacter aestuariivivens TaxID=2766981 RepID=A0A927HF14_9RHOB|nr:FAD-dependent monooxygenase [Sulfitobacter aestuariivivens]MBD3665377.1 FAD-dependent monooxygenase [Sulfitobacter aestuariivivens]